MFEISKRLRYTVCVNENSAEGIGLMVELFWYAHVGLPEKVHAEHERMFATAKSDILSETDRKLS